MDFAFFNALLTNTYESYLHGYYINNFFDDFIDKLPVRYRNVILNNQVKIFESNEWDSPYTPVIPSKYWNNLEEVSEDNATVAEFRELLNFELIRIIATILKKSVLAWRLGLIGSGKKEIIKAEYERLILQLSFYEAEIQNVVHLKLYCDTLLNIIKDIRNDIYILKVYYDDEKLTGDTNTSFVDDSIPKDRENKFNQVPLKDVRAHFEELTVSTSKRNGRPHLTQEQLDKFISMAFLQIDESRETKQKIRMNLQYGEFGRIRAIFYSFYDKCKVDYESTQHTKEKYVRLLTDNFEGFGYKQIANNFSA